MRNENNLYKLKQYFQKILSSGKNQTSKKAHIARYLSCTKGGEKTPNKHMYVCLSLQKYRTAKLENNEVGYLQGVGGGGMEWKRHRKE